MGSTTPKGYPFPVGTDRVMDGDDAIKALALAIDGDALYTKATCVGQALTGAASNPIQWNAASPNGAALTKTNATTWTVTKAGIYVLCGNAITTGFQAFGSRAYMQLLCGPASVYQCRQVFAGENQTTCALVVPLAVGDPISFSVYPSVGTSATADAGFLIVARLGRV